MKTSDNNQSFLEKVWNDTGELPVDQEELQALHSAMGIHRAGKLSRINKWAFAFIAAAIVAIGELVFLTRPLKPVETVSLITAAGSKGDFLLPDGSHVWLNSGSKLSYKSDDPRHVTLEGEGLFNVAKNERHAFIVSTPSTSVKVHGTIFNFRSNPLFDNEEVSLLSGKVEIISGGHSVMLAPGEKATVNSEGIMKSNADVTCDSSWTGSELDFQNVSMDSILASLEHWYNIRFKIMPDINLSRRLSFKIRNESANETFTILNRLSECRFKSLDNNIVLVTK